MCDCDVCCVTVCEEAESFVWDVSQWRLKVEWVGSHCGWIMAEPKVDPSHSHTGTSSLQVQYHPLPSEQQSWNKEARRGSGSHIGPHFSRFIPLPPATRRTLTVPQARYLRVKRHMVRSLSDQQTVFDDLNLFKSGLWEEKTSKALGPFKRAK